MLAMRIHWRWPFLIAAALFALTLSRAQGQQAPATLSLEEAISLARRHNPDYRAQLNDQGVADWAVAESFMSLLPSASLNSNFSYTLPGTPRVLEGFDASQFGLSTQPATYYSSYSFGLFMQISAATFFNIAQARAARRATDAATAAAGYTLDAEVTREYLAAMRSRDGVIVAKQDLETARETKKLADARFAGGAVTQLDPAQADVVVGRAEVALIQAENTHDADKLRLLQRLGLTLERDFELTSKLEVFDPSWSREELVRIALANHPQLLSARASEAASNATSRAAKLSYLPTLNLSGGWSGQAREVGLHRDTIIANTEEEVLSQQRSCERGNKFNALIGDPPQDCSRFVFTPEMGERRVAENNVFPFNFTGQRPSFGVSVSIPIFDGLTRELRLQQARATADDAKQQRRATELNLQTQVATTFGNLMAARRSVDIEQRNVQAAELGLNLARERYRLGGGEFLDLANAQQAKAQADREYLTALYSFHENVAALEAAVGRPLRQR